MQKPSLTPEEIKALQEVGYSLVAMKGMLNTHAESVDKIVAKYTKPKSEASIKKAAEKTEMELRIRAMVQKHAEKRYGK